MFKFVRVMILLVVLAVAAFYTKLQSIESTAWIEPLPVVIHPINADGSVAAARHIAALQPSDFAPIDQFFSRSAQPYSLITDAPTRTRLGSVIEDQPPLPNMQGGVGVLESIWSSLRLRLWARGYAPDDQTGAYVQMFVLYYDPASSPRLPHSMGLQKGLIGVVHAFADRQYQASNRVVMAHELLHTLGASDKYDPTTGHPIYPDGYARLSKPLYPQRQAEIMGGRIPISAHEAVVPDRLADCVIGPLTAREIQWLTDSGG